MATDPTLGNDLLGTAERAITVLRDGLLVALLVFGIVVLCSLWPKWRDQLGKSSIESVTLGAVSIKLTTESAASFQSGGLSVDVVGGSGDILEKGSLQNLLQVPAGRRIELLGLSQGGRYSGELLLGYLSRISPNFVIFRSPQKLDGWIEASVLAAQIAKSDLYTYEELLRVIHGIHTESIAKTATARQALERMQELHFDHLPAVDSEGHFQFMLSRDEILAKVVTSVVLAGSTG
jgi:hypothetical protein